MTTLSEKYQKVLEGKFNKSQFIRDAKLQLPNLITGLNNFNDTVQILKNKGMISEAWVEISETVNEEMQKYKEEESPDYFEERTSDDYSLDHLERAIDAELEEMKFDTVAVNFTEADYNNAKERALKNLEKDKNYYLHKLAGIDSGADRHDISTEVDLKAALSKSDMDKLKDSHNELTKVQLKEGFKKLIKRIINEDRSIGN